MRDDLLAGFLEEMVASGAVSAAVGLVEGPGGRRSAAAGEAPGAAAWFDLGSLTKPFTATLALVLDARGALPLAARVGEVFPEAHPDLAAVPLEDLLRHRAGFKPWFPFYAQGEEPEDVSGPVHDPVRELLLGGGLLGAPPGTYSDLDFLLWGLAAETVLGDSLAALLRRLVFEPLGLEHTAPSPGRLTPVVPCRLDTGREVELAAASGIAVERLAPPPAGIVQDGNARWLGGLAAHAGLFATAGDVAALGREWLRPGRLLDRRAVEKALGGEGPHALGWARRDPRGGAAPLGERAFGHWGFPGGSLWIDRETERLFVLLAHKTAPGVDLTPWRRRFHGLQLYLDRSFL